MTLYHCLHCSKEMSFKGHSYNHKYCDNTCQGQYTRKIRVNEWLKGKKYNNKNIPGWIKDSNGYIAKRDGYKCSVCGMTKHNKKPIVLECDHIDGVNTNQDPKNLRLICPNCHSQTDTFKGRNK